MLTFPLPARIKTLARDTEHDHTSSSAGFYLTKYFSSRLVDFGSRPSQKDDHSEESFWSLRKKKKKCQREDPSSNLAFRGSGDETKNKKQKDTAGLLIL